MSHTKEFVPDLFALQFCTQSHKESGFGGTSAQVSIIEPLTGIGCITEYLSLRHVASNPEWRIRESRSTWGRSLRSCGT
jgi:hypothetical protein